MNTGLLLEQFIFGLSLGIGPCLVYCGLVLFPYVSGAKTNFSEGFKSAIFFSFGRLLSYTVLGGVAGYSGKIISSLFYTGKGKFYIQAIGGIFVFFLGLSLIVAGNKNFRLCNIMRKNDSGSLFLLGVLVGFAPCAPLLANLAYIVLKTSGLLGGVLAGLSFGLGTLVSPILLLAAFFGFLPKKLMGEFRIYAYFQKICGGILMFFAIKIFFISAIR